MWRVVSVVLVGLLIGIAGLAISSSRPAPVETVSLFNRRCSACHGREGSLFEAQFEKKYRNESELKEIVKIMPGADTLSREELEAMVAYMRAISRKEAYIVWTRERTGELEGEISPARARLKASVKRQSLKVERVGSNGWRVRLPKGAKPADVELTAELNGNRTRLRLKDAPYSHTR